MHHYLIWQTTSFLVIILWVHAEVFTALTDMEPLIDVHKKITSNLDNYIAMETKRLNALKRYLERFKAEHEKIMKNISNYLENPINSYTLIKRLTIDIESIEQRIKYKSDYRKIKKTNYPTKEDVLGAAQALVRLQQTYHLNVTELANGVLTGNYSQDNNLHTELMTPMSASDCFELGRALFGAQEFTKGIAWMLEALNKYKLEENEPFTEVDIIEHISYAYFMIDDVENALEWTNKNLMMLKPEDPRYSRAKLTIEYYKQNKAEKDAKSLEQNRNKGKGIEIKINENLNQVPGNVHTDKLYDSLCRGEMDLPARVVKRLKCRYLTETHPFLKLAPIKMEQLYMKPNIFLFHEMLSENEIQHFKDLAKPKLTRAQVHDTKTGKISPALYRICKYAWLDIAESDVIARVSRRIVHCTGLDMSSSPELQVVNYGIGGFYGPHYDFSNFEPTDKWDRGNRIATLLFYLSDVAQGGATVFTELGLSVFPVKGAALFWLNLHPSGEGDLGTRHAGCPVLRGNKWVSTKWLHQLGQELVKPCTLKHQKKGMLYKIPRPVFKESKL